MPSTLTFPGQMYETPKMTSMPVATSATSDDGAEPARQPSSRLGGLVRAMRPKQWVKNVLVLAAPVLGERANEAEVLGQTAIAFVVFCLAASGIYLINDARDINEDRAHPTKRFRPIAAGVVPVRLAIVVGAALLVVACGVAALLETSLAIVIAVYAVIQIAYCLFLKDEPVIDIAIIASGFLLRAIAGGAASDIDLSQWFLMAAAFGSLFMAAGKRYAEVHIVDADPIQIRRSLAKYSESYLRFVWSVSAAVLIMVYGMWAFELRDETGSVLAPISMAPFVLGVLRYAVDIDAGRAGAPEEIVLSDHVLQAFAVACMALVAIAVY